MSEPPQLPATTCLRCGASNPPHAAKCWLCERNDTKNPYAVQSHLQSNAPPQRGSSLSAQGRVEVVFASLLIGALILAIIVGVGIAAQDPGLLIPYLIVIAPPIMATSVRALVSVSQHKKPSAYALFMTFLWSGLFTILALVLLVVATVVALFVWCLHMLAGQ